MPRAAVLFRVFVDTNEFLVPLEKNSVQYMAPEFLSGKYDEKIDVHSFGIVLTALLNATEPYEGTSSRKIKIT